MLSKEDFEFVGTLGRAHGIQGEVSAKLSVDLSGLWEGVDTSLFLMLEEQGLLIPYRVLKLRAKGDEIDLVTFSGITTKEEAEALTGRPVWLDRDYLSDEEAEELFELQHYVGYELYDASSDASIGVIEEIDDSTLNTLLRVRTHSDEELVLPISEELVDRLDIAEHRLYLHIPAGLLEL